ncbi:MAG: hypothetical protein ACI9MC_002559 [Kiritimatiellia bacterium]
MSRRRNRAGWSEWARAVRFSARVVVVFVAMGMPACGWFDMGPPAPKYERGVYDPLMFPPPFFEVMDLPYYGGLVEQVTPLSMRVAYTNELTHEQLLKRWPRSLEAEGWLHLSGGEQHEGRFDGAYRLRDGRSGRLQIDPEGSVWKVRVSVQEFVAPE